MRGARLVAALAAAVVAGCSSTAWNDMRENPREYFNLVSPTLQTDGRVDGQRVTLRRGQALVVRLEEDVTTGQRWQMVALPQGPLIAPVQHDVVMAAGADAASRGGEAVFRMRGVASGTQPVVLEYRRADEAAASKTVRFDIVVR
jgi:predicted secreted protein